MSAPTPKTYSRDPYTVLGVPPETPFAEVKVVYRRLVRELHPDANPDDPQARQRFEAVQEAFASLRALNTRAITSSIVPPETEIVSAEAAHATLQIDRFPTPPPSAAKPATEPLEVPRPSPPPMPETLTIAAVEAPAPMPTAPSMPSYPTTAAHLAALQVNIIPSRDRMVLQPKAQMVYALLDLQPDPQLSATTQPLNLALVLDHSSSMQRDGKMQRLKQAVSRIIDIMSPQDYLSITTFGDRATVLLPSRSLQDKQAAKSSLDGIRCHGGTEISTGIRAGLEQLQAYAGQYISQMIVLTDGQTYGDEDVCLALASQAADQHMQITALGLGDDWNSKLLDEIATRTGAYSDYVQSAEHLATTFEEQLRSLQQTALRNVSISISTGPNSRLLRATWVAPGIRSLPIPTEPSTTVQPAILDVGRISINREYRLLIELVVAGRGPGRIEVADLTCAYEFSNPGRQPESVTHRLETTFVEQDEGEPPVDLRVHDALRKITAHRLQEQAMQAIQEGQTQKGTASLRMAATHLEASGCTELAELAKKEAARVERQGQVQSGNMKRIIYGTRKLG